MKFTEGALALEFKDAISGFKFDETDKVSDHYHGLTHCMKGVDLIIELPEQWLFVEIKDLSHPAATAERKQKSLAKVNDGILIKELVTKYKDTFLYRWAEGSADKPISYLCLITLESPLILQLMKTLKRQLPEGKASNRWNKSLAERCIVANIDTWNASFKQWPVNRVNP